MNIDSFKRRLSEININIDKNSTILIQRQAKRDTYLKQLKDEFGITDEIEIETKLKELRTLYTETDKKLDDVLIKMESNLKKIEVTLNQ